MALYALLVSSLYLFVSPSEGAAQCIDVAFSNVDSVKSYVVNNTYKSDIQLKSIKKGLSLQISLDPMCHSFKADERCVLSVDLYGNAITTEADMFSLFVVDNKYISTASEFDWYFEVNKQQNNYAIYPDPLKLHHLGSGNPNKMMSSNKYYTNLRDIISKGNPSNFGSLFKSRETYLQNVWPLTQTIINDPIVGEVYFHFKKNGTTNDIPITYHDNFLSNAPISVFFTPDDAHAEIFDISSIGISFQCSSNINPFVYIINALEVVEVYEYKQQPPIHSLFSIKQ